MPSQSENSRNLSTTDQPLDKLFKLLPAELTATYLSVRAILPTESDDESVYLLIFGAIILLISPIFMKRLLGVTNKTQLLFLTFSLAIWMLNIDIQKVENIEGPVNTWATAHMMGWFLPYVVNATFVKALLVLWVGILVPLTLGRAGQEGDTKDHQSLADSKTGQVAQSSLPKTEAGHV